MTRKILWFTFLLIWFFGKSQVKEGFVLPENPKIGLSLSGGGAKGFAHIGVLKVIDSLGIKIDYISGTSMGAIVGGLYAAGYKADEIEKFVMKTDFYTLIANEKTRQETPFFYKTTDKYLLTLPIKNGKVNVLPKAISTGQKNIYVLEELFKNVSHITDFSELPIPFLCIATNLENGKMEIFEEGDLVSTIMASSAFPSLMDPVQINDSLYIDGAMTLNLPSEPLKNKGIDIVIGVDLSQPLTPKEQLNSVLAIFNQIIDFGIKKENKRQYEFTDITIKPDLSGLSATSYSDKEKILQSGYYETLKYASVLSKLPKRESPLRSSVHSVFSNVYKIDQLILENNNIFDQNYIQGKMNLKLPSLQTYGSINKMIGKLYATNNYYTINYDIIQQNNENHLKLILSEVDTRFFLKAGLHYDEVFKTGLLLNATIKRLLFRNSIISLDLIVGDKPRYYFNYFIDNGYIPGFGVYSSGMSFDFADGNNENISWNWFRNDVFIQSVWRDKFAVGGGFNHEYFKTNLHSTGNFINPYVFIKSDTRDDRNFPSRGFFMDINGKYLDFFNDNPEKKTFQTKALLNFNFPLTQSLTYQLSFFGGITANKEISPYYKFRAGGIFEQELGNFSSFPGMKLAEISNDNMMSVSQTAQFRFQKNFFVAGNFNMLTVFDEVRIRDMLHIHYISGGLSVGYRSPLGPVKINYSMMINKKKSGIFNIMLGHWF